MPISEHLTLAAIFYFGQVFYSVNACSTWGSFSWWLLISFLQNIFTKRNHLKKQHTDSLMYRKLVAPYSIKKAQNKNY